MRALAIALFLLVGCNENYHYSFATGTEAIDSDAAKRGWIPDWLPGSAREVQLQYDLDTNERWIRFELAERDRILLASQFSRVPEGAIAQLQFRGAPREEFWFESLIVQHPANDNGIHAQVFRGERALLFFEEGSPKVYAYLPG